MSSPSELPSESTSVAESVAESVVESGSEPISPSASETTSAAIASDTFPITDRTKLKRLPKRGNYDRALVHSILDEGLICHVGFAVNGQPVVIPTAYGRIGDRLYLHGSPASRMLRTLKEQVQICVTVTLLDGLVLARSAFHHSMNYRSVVLFGMAEVVNDPAEKLDALRAFTEHIVAGRWPDIRPPSPQELNGTLVLSIPIEEASAKVRTGPPIDDDEDYALPVWAGVLPLGLAVEAAQPDPKLPAETVVPKYLTAYTRGGDLDPSSLS